MDKRFNIIISDVHLDTWEHDTNIDKLEDFLIKVKEINQYVGFYILGDLYEQPEHKIAKIKNSFKNIIDLLITIKNQFDYKTFYGNHDKNYNDGINEAVNAFYESNNAYKKCYCHGHGFDPLFNKSEENTLMKLSLLERAIYFYNKIEKIYNFDTDDNFITTKYNKIIIDKAKKHIKDNTIIILGHTHELSDFGNVINTGCWVNGHADYVIEDIENKKFYLYKFHNEDLNLRLEQIINEKNNINNINPFDRV
jgi:predicted phosphodiesterase